IGPTLFTSRIASPTSSIAAITAFDAGRRCSNWSGDEVVARYGTGQMKVFASTRVNAVVAF
ncbi:MAG TPA: hypothetical protein VNU21_15265, partial [Usitatibacter sp.]|nr:hypothetical protein [Usitatibacter sp.]